MSLSNEIGKLYSYDLILMNNEKLRLIGKVVEKEHMGLKYPCLLYTGLKTPVMDCNYLEPTRRHYDWKEFNENSFC